jgi:ATP-dependent DNA helicase RecQ
LFHSDQQLHETLKSVFGYDAFRLTQLEIIKRSLANQSSLVIMPTGGGKSICYQLPAVLMDGLSIVISPLISLMQDQVGALTSNGISAASLNSSGTYEDELLVKKQVANNELKLLYVSPERAVSNGFITWIQQQNVRQIAIDEAHCVSIWGNDFRPEYTRLTELTRLFTNIPIIALTATADTATQADIRKQLQLESCESYVSSFERTNLTLNVLPANDRIEVIKKFLIRHEDKPGIIYCLSRRSTEDIALKLKKAGFNSHFYHAALKPQDRARIQDDFQQDKIQIVCATIAFGMGIDKANISWVIHYNLPKNIEGYYQEIGRAGRAGQDSETLLFAGYRDMKTLKDFIDHSGAAQQFKEVQTAKLQRMWEFTQATSCRTNFILNYFGEFKDEPCGHCDRCLDPPNRFDGTIISQIALSACLRLNQQVNLSTLVDVIRGSSRQDIIQNGYHQIKTYGVGKDIDYKSWVSYITQLIDQGVLSIDYTQGSRLVLTELAKPILKSEKSILLTEPQVIDFKTKENVKGNNDLSETENTLYAALSALRRSLADEEQVQASRIFSNASLTEMAKVKPGNLLAFSSISGVGKFKLEKYAEVFIKLILDLVPKEDCLFQDDEDLLKSSRSKPKPKTAKKVKESGQAFTLGKISKTHELTYEMLATGLSPEDIAEQRKVKVETIYSHMFRLSLSGKSLDISNLIDEDDILIIQEKWLELDKPDSSKLMFHKLDERYRYDQIDYAITYLHISES